MTHSRPSVVATETNDAWDGAVPTVSLLVATYQRPEYLAELLDALAAQTLEPGSFEVVVVDNGSTDDTWDRLVPLVHAIPVPAAAVRVSHNEGPAAGRNLGVEVTRADVIAITDDDCLPTATWASGMRDALVGGASVVQGRVDPDPRTVADMGPWDHTKSIRNPTPFFETCNVGYRREAFLAAGGFDEDDPLLHPPSGRAFGEDACLAWTVISQGGESAWVPEAIVHHRCVPSTYGRWLADQRELAGFPGLARRSPLIADWLYRGIFLDRRSARFDLAVVSAAAALFARRPALALGTLPWLHWRAAAARSHSRYALEFLPLLVRLGWSDTVALASMLKGSIRHRRVVL